MYTHTHKNQEFDDLPIKNDGKKLKSKSYYIKIAAGSIMLAIVLLSAGEITISKLIDDQKTKILSSIMAAVAFAILVSLIIAYAMKKIKDNKEKSKPETLTEYKAIDIRSNNGLTSAVYSIIKDKQGNHKEIKNLILDNKNYKVDYSKTFDNGDTIIHTTISNCNDDKITQLIFDNATSKITPNDTTDVENESQHNKDKKLFKDLFEKLNNDQLSPISLIVKTKNIKLLKILIKNYKPYFDINKQYGSDNKTLLHLAIENKDKKTVILLINNFQDSMNFGILDNNQLSALDLAIKTNDTEIANYIISVYQKHNKTINVNTTKNKEKNILHYAAKANVKIFEKLLDYLGKNGNNIDNALKQCDKNGNYPLDIAVKNNSIDVVKLLLKNGVDINSINRNGDTALHIAVENNHTDMVKLLLKNDINIINSINRNRETALHIAVENNHTDMVKLLLKNNININSINYYGDTALHMAIKQNNIKIVSALIDTGNIDHTIKNRDDDTLLDIAIKNNVNYKILEKLILLSKDKKTYPIKDLLGSNGTVLHVLLKNSNHLMTNKHDCINLKKSIEILLDNGATINTKDENGKLPIQLFIEYNNINQISETDIYKNIFNALSIKLSAENKKMLIPYACTQKNCELLDAIFTKLDIKEFTSKKYKKDNNEPTESSFFPIELAIQKGGIEVARKIFDLSDENTIQDVNYELYYDKFIQDIISDKSNTSKNVTDILNKCPSFNSIQNHYTSKFNEIGIKPVESSITSKQISNFNILYSLVIAENKNESLYKELLDKDVNGAFDDIPYNLYYILLSKAANSNALKSFKLLYEKYANKIQSDTNTDHSDVIEKILLNEFKNHNNNNNNDINTNNHKLLELFNCVTSNNDKFNINCIDNNGNTLLHYAFDLIDPLNMVTAILRYNPDISIKNKTGKTPLHCFAGNISFDNYIEDTLAEEASLAKKIKEDPNVINICNDDKENVLHIICKQEVKEKNYIVTFINKIHPIIGKKLLDDCLSAQDHNGKIPIHLLLDQTHINENDLYELSQLGNNCFMIKDNENNTVIDRLIRKVSTDQYFTIFKLNEDKFYNQKGNYGATLLHDIAYKTCEYITFDINNKSTPDNKIETIKILEKTIDNIDFNKLNNIEDTTKEKDETKFLSLIVNGIKSEYLTKEFTRSFNKIIDLYCSKTKCNYYKTVIDNLITKFNSTEIEKKHLVLDIIMNFSELSEENRKYTITKLKSEFSKLSNLKVEQKTQYIDCSKIIKRLNNQNYDILLKSLPTIQKIDLKDDNKANKSLEALSDLINAVEKSDEDKIFYNKTLFEYDYKRYKLEIDGIAYEPETELENNLDYIHSKVSECLTELQTKSTMLNCFKSDKENLNNEYKMFNKFLALNSIRKTNTFDYNAQFSKKMNEQRKIFIEDTKDKTLEYHSNSLDTLLSKAMSMTNEYKNSKEASAIEQTFEKFKEDFDLIKMKKYNNQLYQNAHDTTDLQNMIKIQPKLDKKIDESKQAFDIDDNEYKIILCYHLATENDGTVKKLPTTKKENEKVKKDAQITAAEVTTQSQQTTSIIKK